MELKPNVWEFYNSKTVIATLQISAMLDYGKECFWRIRKGFKINEIYIGSGGHGDHSTRLFSSQKGFYDGQWPLTSRYFKSWFYSNIPKYVN